MTKGYLLFAIDTDIDYTKLAYACAMSIKITQPEGFNSVAIVTDNPSKVPAVFDHVIEYTGPKGMDARSRALDYTPFDETVLLDSDMLFLKPMDHYWDLFKDFDLYVTTAPQSYKGVHFTHGEYRKIFADNMWPNLYNAYTYFKKDSALSKEFFELVKTITDDPTEFIQTLVPNSDLKTIPTDEAFAIAIAVLDIEKVVTVPEWQFPRITHMKPAVQQWPTTVLDWNEKLRFSINQAGQVKLGVWGQSELLHYVKKELITDDVIRVLEAQCSM